MSGIPILYRDEHLVAVHKPSGLLVHRSEIDRHETRFALQLVRDLIGRRVYPVHRLDKPTSGVLLMALSPEVARALGEQFAANEVEKRYLAVVRGWCEEAGAVDHPLREQLDRMTDRRARTDKGAQAAVTEYRRLATIELPIAVERHPTSRYSLVEARPRTGRKHQIRRHMKHIAHPVIGDSTHGKGRHNRMFAERLNADRLLLAAMEMALRHPVGGEPLRITAPLDGRFRALLERFGWLDALPEAWRGDE